MLETMNLSSQNCSEKPWAQGEESTTVGIAFPSFLGVRLFRVLSREEASMLSAEWPGALSKTPESRS